MAFCINCGQELADGAKFCAGCGKAVNDSNSTTQRKTTYDGEIHKCPNCGEILGQHRVIENIKKQHTKLPAKRQNTPSGSLQRAH